MKFKQVNPLVHYQKFDNMVMRGVNLGVRAWNWTTGRTRADLVGSVSVAGIVLGAMAAYKFNQPPSILFGLGPALIPIFACNVYVSFETDKKEAKAIESGMKDADVERVKNSCKFLGPLGIGSGITFPLGPGGAVWYTAMGVSLYVMRADYLPPQKNVLERSLDSLRELTYNLKRQLRPVPG